MMKRLWLAFLFLTTISATISAITPADALQKAAANGAPALLLVTDSSALNVDQALSMVNETAKQIKGCVTVEMDRSDKANAELVTKYGLAGAPVPLILVFASNGAIAGGLPAAQATPEKLANLLPSPKEAEVFKELQSGNAVMIVASTKAMREQAKAMANCAGACSQLKGKATTVRIDLSDPAEQRFLQLLRVNTAAESPVTLVINPQGQITGNFMGPVEVAALVQAATRKVSGGCCSGGSGASCGTAKK
jgi:hypothetical protein